MIESLRSKYTSLHPPVGTRGLAIDTGHQGSMKGKVGVLKSFLSLGGKPILSQHSFYLLCHSMS